jgi:hypothetical protein
LPFIGQPYFKPQTLTEWNIPGFSMIEFLLLLKSSAHSSNSSWAELALFSASFAEGLHNIAYGLHNIGYGMHNIAYGLQNIPKKYCQAQF